MSEKMQPSNTHVPGPLDDEEEATTKASRAEPVYAYRPVMNAEMIREWAATQGFERALPADDMHVTVVFSKAPFDADITNAAREHGIIRHDNVVVRGGKRTITPLGDKGAVVLKIESAALQCEHLSFREMGASWDFQEYTPHITITYSGTDAPIAQMQPFEGDIVLGPLRAKPLNPDWDGEVVETALTKAERATYQPPAGAKGNAERALRWREEHGSAVRGGTAVGWTRARQLASGDRISRETVARMSAFNRHRSNATVDPKFKDEPWRDAGHVAWLLWGGTTGVDWARDIMQRAEKSDSSPDLSCQGNSGRFVETGGSMSNTFVKTAEVIKMDSERRIAWGWASVSTLKGDLVVDRQGDVITPTEMEKMADGFMASARTAKAMHEGEGVGEVLHSLPLTKELAEALGLQADREGWIIGMKIHDDDTWAMFKSGELAAFSIGGKAKRSEVS